MKAYGIGFVQKIKNLPLYMEWAKQASKNMAKGGGRSIARNGTFVFKSLDGGLIPKAGRMKLVEGKFPLPARMAVVEFPSYEKALAWYRSPGMNKIRPMRNKAAIAWTLLVEETPASKRRSRTKTAAKAATKRRR